MALLIDRLLAGWQSETLSHSRAAVPAVSPQGVVGLARGQVLWG